MPDRRESSFDEPLPPIEYSLVVEDQNHQTNGENVIKTISVIDKWKRAVTKAQANKTYDNDVKFLEKVLG